MLIHFMSYIAASTLRSYFANNTGGLLHTRDGTKHFTCTI